MPSEFKTEPLCPGPVQRRYSSRPLPPYRFIPGINAHPVRDAEGHSFGRDHAKLRFMPAEEFAVNEHYLFGVDLYNQAYWWESHEAWEDVWHTTDKSSDYGQLLQGLIQVSAAFIKWHLEQREGMVKLYEIGMGRLKSVAAQQTLYMGIDLPKHLHQLEKHFEPVLLEGSPWRDACADYPFIVLDF